MMLLSERFFRFSMRSFTCVPLPEPCGPKNRTVRECILLEIVALFFKYRYDLLDSFVESPVGIHYLIVVLVGIFSHLPFRDTHAFFDLVFRHTRIPRANATLEFLGRTWFYEYGHCAVFLLEHICTLSPFDVYLRKNGLARLKFFLEIREVRSIMCPECRNEPIFWD